MARTKQSNIVPDSPAGPTPEPIIHAKDVFDAAQPDNMIIENPDNSILDNHDPEDNPEVIVANDGEIVTIDGRDLGGGTNTASIPTVFGPAPKKSKFSGLYKLIRKADGITFYISKKEADGFKASKKMVEQFDIEGPIE